MPDQSESQLGTAATAAVQVDLPEPGPILDALDAMKSRAESVLATMLGRAENAAAKNDEIEQGRAFAEKARGDIQAQVAATQEAVVELKQQVEIARASVSDSVNISYTIKTATQQTEEAKAQALASLENIRNHAATANETVSRIEAIKTNAEQTQAVIAEKNAQIESGRQHADEVRAALNVVLNEARQSATNAEAQSQASVASLSKVNELYTTAQTAKANMDSIAESVMVTRTAVDAHATITKRLAEVAETTEARIATYESLLKSLVERSDAQNKVIDELLSGATNAGLSSAFDKRSKTFIGPMRMWQGIFIFSLVGLLGLAILEALNTTARPAEWQELARMLLHRLPFLAPLIWLAIHASRQASFAKRMEEEYAFKATTSMSFEGYRRQMADVGKDLAADSPLAQLCNDALRIIASPPGRIYDKQRMDPTPATAVTELAKSAADMAKSLTGK